MSQPSYHAALLRTLILVITTGPSKHQSHSDTRDDHDDCYSHVYFASNWFLIAVMIRQRTASRYSSASSGFLLDQSCH